MIPINTAYEKHGHDDAAREEGAGGVAGEEEVDDEHDDHGRVGELLVRVLGVQVVHRLLTRSVEEGGGLAVGPVPQYAVGAVVAGEDGVLDGAGVELEVHLVVGVARVGRLAHVLVLAVRVRVVRAGDGRAAFK